MSRIFSTAGMVLDRREHKEADRLYIFLSPTMGKLEMLAKGGAKISAKLTPHLESLGVVKILLVEGRRGLTIAGVDRLESFHTLALRPRAALFARAGLSLTDILTRPHGAESRLYEQTESWLRFLCGTGDERLDTLSWFLHTLQCLAAAGYEPELGSCVECRMPLVEGGWWSALRGGLLCEVCRDTQEGGGYKKIQKGTVRALSFGLTHSLNEINRLERSAPVLSEIEEVVETLLWAHAPVLPAVSLRQMVSC